MVYSDIDIRDQWMGLKYLRKSFVPVPLGMKDAKGSHAKLHDRAQAAANFIGTQNSGKTTMAITQNDST